MRKLIKKWMCVIIIKIDKNEMEYFRRNGVNIGENGVSHTNSRHRRTYYLAESKKNMSLHKKYQEMITVDTVK